MLRGRRERPPPELDIGPHEEAEELDEGERREQVDKQVGQALRWVGEGEQRVQGSHGEQRDRAEALGALKLALEADVNERQRAAELQREVDQDEAVALQQREHAEQRDSLEPEAGEDVVRARVEEEEHGHRQAREEDALLVHLVSEEEEGHGRGEQREQQPAAVAAAPQRQVGRRHRGQRRQRGRRHGALARPRLGAQQRLRRAPEVGHFVLEEPATDREHARQHGQRALAPAAEPERAPQQRERAEHRRGDQQQPPGRAVANAAEEQVREEDRRVEQRHLLEVQCQTEAGGRRQVPPVEQRRHSRQHQAQAHAIELEVPVVDRQQRRLQRDHDQHLQCLDATHAGADHAHEVERRGEEDQRVGRQHGRAHEQDRRRVAAAARHLPAYRARCHPVPNHPQRVRVIRRQRGVVQAPVLQVVGRRLPVPVAEVEVRCQLHPMPLCLEVAVHRRIVLA